MNLIYIVDLISYYTQSGIFIYVFNFLIALAFVATVPCIIRSFFRR